MSKEEIALELTKISYQHHIKVKSREQLVDVEKEVTNLFNYIYENLKVSEENK